MSSTMDCRLGVTLAEGVSEWGFAGGVEGALVRSRRGDRFATQAE